MNLSNTIYKSTTILNNESITMETFTSIIETIKERATNPFFGTLIGVWLCRNWLLVYTVFNFDEGTNLKVKQKFIETYFSKQDFWIELGTNVGISLAFVVMAFSLMVITRIIINVANHRLTPYFNSKTVSKLVVNNNRFQTVKKQRDDFFTSLEDAQETIINLEQRNSLLRSENTELESIKAENSTLKVDVQNLENTRKVILDDLKKSKNETAEKFQEISQLKHNIKQLNQERKLIDKIFLRDYIDFDSLPALEEKNILKNLPSELTQPYDVLESNATLKETLNNIKQAEDNPFGETKDINLENVKKLVSLGLVNIFDDTLGYEIENLELSPLAKLIEILEKPLNQNWRNINLPF